MPGLWHPHVGYASRRWRTLVPTPLTSQPYLVSLTSLLNTLCTSVTGHLKCPSWINSVRLIVETLILLCVCVSDGAGICDPCEKELTDAIGHLDMQQREDITQSAQVSRQNTTSRDALLPPEQPMG